MRLEGFLRTQLKRLLTKQSYVALESKVPLLESRFQDIAEFGLYLHIPFCRQICPYCPYNKEIYHPEVAERYTSAVKKEIDIYSELIGNRPVTSLYIGGGTPTTMLYSGLGEILEHVFEGFNVHCDIHMESHPNDLTLDNLNAINSLGVRHLSVGVEALQDHHLKTLRRPYSVEQVITAVGRAANNGFKCVNADFIFALPGQTCGEVEQAGRTLVEMGIDQVAAYPLFRFPYTKLGRTAKENNHSISNTFKRRKMLGLLERIFYDAGFERTSVWAFTRPGIPRYCSVTVPLYVGLGASGGSYLKDVFYLNTFNVQEYISALENGRMPIALSLDLTENMQMAGWLYWRIYEWHLLASCVRRLILDRIHQPALGNFKARALTREDSFVIEGEKMNLLKKITVGVTDESVYRRIGWMVVSFFLLYVSVTVLSYYLLPEGILRGKHPIISRLQFSPHVWVSTLQIFGYNLIPTTLIIAGNLLAQQSRLVQDRFVPIGYTAFWGLTILFAVITGSWSFDVVTAAPPLHYRFVRMFDILHHSGLLEFSAYLLAAAASFKFTLWYSDRKKIIASREWRDVKLTKSETAFLMLVFVLLFCGAYVESYGINQLTR